MAITYVGAGTPDALATAITLTMPAGVAEDDFLILLQGGRSADITAGQTPSGWTEFTGLGLDTTGSTDGIVMSAYYKFAGASEGSVTTGDYGNHNAGVVVAFRGVDTTSPLDDTQTTNQTTQTTSFSVGGITTTTADCMVVDLSYIQDDTANPGSPTNASLDSITNAVEWSHVVGNDGTLFINYGIDSTAGSVNATTATLATSERFAGIQIALVPAGGAASTATPSGRQTLSRQSAAVAATKLGGVLQ